MLACLCVKAAERETEKKRNRKIQTDRARGTLKGTRVGLPETVKSTSNFFFVSFLTRLVLGHFWDQ